MSDFLFYNLVTGTRSPGIDLLFPDWTGSAERVVVLSPHDDDVILGAGYLVLAAAAVGGQCHVIVFCDGSGGYTDPALADQIVNLRREESARAYAELGLGPDRVVRLDYPDYSIRPHIGWRVPSGRGTTEHLVRELRRIGATRVLVPNGHREHIDHHAVRLTAGFDIPQAGDPVKPDWGVPTSVSTVLEYPVWGQLAPDEPGDELAITVPAATEQLVRAAIGQMPSQLSIIENLVEARERRRTGDRYLEPYRRVDPRPGPDLAPYRDRINEIDHKEDF